MSYNSTLHSLGLTPSNDPRLVKTSGNTEQRPLYKIKSRPKKRLHNVVTTSPSVQEGFVDEPIIGPPAKIPSNGQYPHSTPSSTIITEAKEPSEIYTQSIRPSPKVVAEMKPAINKTASSLKTPTKQPSTTNPSTSHSCISGAPIQQSPIIKLPETNVQLKQRAVSPIQPKPIPEQGNSSNACKPTNPSSTPQNATVPLFSWETYLQLFKAEAAPESAFMQSREELQNRFLPGMKLAARDPRNPESWCLASVVEKIAIRLRLRFDGSDSMNDFFELIDSENIKPFQRAETLHPPVAYKGNIATYPKFVDKVVTRPNTEIAEEEYFINPPKRPEANLFKEGMKLEAIDRKNPFIICPATVGEVKGQDIRIVFDGWRGSFDYTCPYYSRDIFPINWCKRTKHSIAPPNGWEQFFLDNDGVKKVKSPAPKSSQQNSSLNSSSNSSKDSGSVGYRNAKKTRGRPKKEIQKMIQSTPTKNTSVEIDDDNQDNLDDLDDLEEDVDDLGNISGELQYQCQRTVPYDEWRDSKNKIVTEPEQDHMNTTASSLNVSDSTSLASTISKPITKPISECSALNHSETEPASKKSRLEHQQETAGSGTTNASRNYDSWPVEEVLNLIKSDQSLAKYASVFEENEIDGKAFALLNTDIMINHLGLKIGPVLKINNLIEQIKRNK